LLDAVPGSDAGRGTVGGGAWGRTVGREKNGPGVSDTEIKIGQTIAYSGPASSFGPTGQTIAAYYRMINDRGGINGRKINFISADDGYSPPKTVEQNIENCDWRRLRLPPMPICFPARMRLCRLVKQPTSSIGRTADTRCGDALGTARNDFRAIEAGLHAAVDKMWATLDNMGLMVSVHKTRDISDSIQPKSGS